MWMPNMKKIDVLEEEDDVEEAWELAEAVAEDTRRTMATIWPPRSYTCSFCRREFRSAQALGGHMNVHRRDRARLNHQAQVQALARYPTSGPTLPNFYQLGNYRNNGHGGVSLLPITNNSKLINYDEIQVNEVAMKSSFTEVRSGEDKMYAGSEELDLELRLGYIPTPASHEKLFGNNSDNNTSFSNLNFRL